MFAADDILISDAVLDAPFACVLGACRGACCVQGDAGAPLLWAYGADGYDAFHDAWTARRQADSSSSRAPETPC